MSEPRSATPHGRLAPPPAPASGAPGEEFARLVEIMRVLRSPDGCPWDREQTLESLRPFVLEEAHEVVDAIERADLDGLRGEIGDLVFEGVFLAQLCSDAGAFSIGDAIRAVNEKLVRRHPHVFADSGADTVRSTGVDTAGAVLEQWEAIKARERAEAGATHAGALEGIPRSMPALLAAHEIGVRAAAVGFDWSTPSDVVGKIEEEVAEVRHALDDGDTARVVEEIGDLFFTLANLARRLGVEPEAALRAANRKFGARFRRMEQLADLDGQTLGEMTAAELETLWQRVKGEAEPTP